MMRHLGWIVVLAFLCSLTGCDCEGVQPKPDCDCEPSITFLSPTSGSLTDFQDSNRNPSDGIQYPVRVQTRCIPPGTTLKLTRGSTELTAEVVADVGVTGRANFGDLSFTAGANHICVASGAILITTDEDGGQDCQPRSVSQVEACKDVEVSVGVPACRFENPEDGITLTAADDSAADQPGFQHDVTILCTGITAGSELQLTAGSAPPRSAPLISLALPLTKVTFTDVGLTEGANLLAAFVPDAAVRTEIEVTVNTGSCAVRLQPPDGTTFNLADDVDLDTPRLQVAFTATTDTDGPFACQDGSTVVVHLGEETHTGILEAGQLRIVATLTESGKLPAYAEVVEPGGRRGRSLDHTYQVSLALQTCTFDDPPPNAVLAGSADSSAAIGFQHDVAVTCRGVNAGRFLNLTVGNNPAIAVALETVDASSVRAVFKDVSFSQGRNLLVAETIGQDGMPVRADAVITVDTGECAVRLLPPDGSVFSIADDIDPATPRLQVRFTVETDFTGAHGGAGRALRRRLERRAFA